MKKIPKYYQPDAKRVKPPKVFTMSANSTTAMHIDIFVNSSGLEALAKGAQPYYWDLCIRVHNPEDTSVPTDCILVAGPVLLTLPTPEEAVPVAVAALQAKLKRVYIDAEQEATEVKGRICNLLAIGHTSAA